MNLAYIAGFLDGEGCIGFYATRSGIVPRVDIANTNLEILEKIQSVLGGCITVPKKRAGWKQGYHLVFTGCRAVELLRKLYKYIYVKREQTHLIFAWDTVRPGSGRKLTQETKEAYDLIKRQSNWLNFKGTGNRGLEPVQEILDGIK